MRLTRAVPALVVALGITFAGTAFAATGHSQVPTNMAPAGSGRVQFWVNSPPPGCGNGVGYYVYVLTPNLDDHKETFALVLAALLARRNVSYYTGTVSEGFSGDPCEVKWIAVY